MKKIYLAVSLIMVCILLSSCQNETSNLKNKPLIMSSNEIINNLVADIGGDFIETNEIIRKGNDPHSYTATEKDIIKITDSSLIIYNGANFEGKLKRALSKIGNITPAVAIIDNIPKDRLIYDNENNINPHIWLNPHLWKIVSSFLVDSLSSINMAYQQVYMQNEEVVLYILHRLDNYIKEQVEKIPLENRIIVTEHDAFAYFGKQYGFETYSLQDSTALKEVTYNDINKLADILINKKVNALFLEATLPDKNIKLLQSTLKSRGYFVKIGGILYSDTLGYNNSYEDMMKYNIDIIVSALQSK